MATIGHTLTGMTICGSWSATLPGRVLPAVWPGLLILSAHLIDLVEWGLTVARPESFTQHGVTHSPWLIATTLLAPLLVLAIVFRVRSPMPYLLVAAAILSHVVLDLRAVREAVVSLYGATVEGDEGAGLGVSIRAECWLFGFCLVAALLLRTLIHTGVRTKSGRLSAGLLALTMISVITRLMVIWAPTYLLSLIHASLALRWRPSLKLAWNLVPLTPLLLLLGVEAWAGRTEQHARSLQAAGRLAEALSLHRAALATPTRSDKTGIYIHMSLCLRDLGDLDGAERALLSAEKGSEQPQWPRLTRAQLYVWPGARGTAMYRPDAARQILEDMRSASDSGRYARIAEFHLDRLRRQGVLPP